jgi:hypothetical protein
VEEIRAMSSLQTCRTTRSRPRSLIVYLVFASATAALAQDRPENKPSPSQGKAIMPKQLLQSLVGSWEGTCQTWFQPGKLADESKVKGKIRPLLGGRFYRHEDEGKIQGKPRHGEETIVFHSMAKRFQVSWVDDFHMKRGSGTVLDNTAMDSVNSEHAKTATSR